jgi:hypothetical protein
LALEQLRALAKSFIWKVAFEARGRIKNLRSIVLRHGRFAAYSG